MIFKQIAHSDLAITFNIKSKKFNVIKSRYTATQNNLSLLETLEFILDYQDNSDYEMLKSIIDKIKKLKAFI